MRAFDRHRLHLHLGIDSQQESGSTVGIAFAVDALVAIAKTVAAVLTGSASMLAEAVHSWVDTGNSCFLLGAARSIRRPADEQHPLGYGRASYVWSLFASIGMFIVGAAVGVWHGISQLGARDGASDYLAGYVVIAISFVLEGASFVQVLRKVRQGAADFGRGVFEHTLRTSNAPMRAVFTEDFTALVALAVAALGMGLRQMTGNGTWDAVGSILIGVLMGAMALMLINQNRLYLEGKAISPQQRAEAIGLLREFPEIERITFLYTEIIGPDRLLLVAGVSIAGDHTQTELAYVLRDLEHRIMDHKNVGLAILTLATPDEEDVRP
jgi:cation diffusion facilitator family transporter